MKRKLILLTIIIIIGGVGIFLFIQKDKKNDITDKTITLEEYKEYDKYGFYYSKDESSVYSFVAGLIDLNTLEEVNNMDSMKVYTATGLDEYADVKDNLPLCKTLREITCFVNQGGYIQSLIISYIDNNNDEIILSYFSDGSVLKTVYFVSKDQLVEVSSNLKKDVYYEFRK